MRLVDILGGDLTGGGDGSVSAVGAIHQPEGDAGNRGLHRLGSGLQGQGLAGAQDGGLRLGNGNGLGQAAHLDLHGGGLPAAVGGSGGNGHGALTGQVGDDAVLYGQDLGVGGLPAQALHGIGGIELAGEGQGLLGVHIHVEGLAVDDLAASQDLHLGDGGIDGDGVLDGGGAVLRGPHEGHIVPGGNRIGLHGTGRGDGGIGCVLGVLEGPGDAVLGDGVALGIHSLQGGGLAANQPGIHVGIHGTGLHRADDPGILTQRIVGTVQVLLPPSVAGDGGERTAAGIEVGQAIDSLVLGSAGIHIGHLADGPQAGVVALAGIAMDLVVNIQTSVVANNGAHSLALRVEVAAEGIAGHFVGGSGVGLDDDGVAALDTADFVGAGDRAGDSTMGDVGTHGVISPAANVAAADDTAGLFAAGFHSAVEFTVGDLEGGHGVILVAHDTAHAVHAVNGSVALTAFNGTVDSASEGTDLGLGAVIADDHASFRHAIPDGDHEVAGAAGEGVGGDVGDLRVLVPDFRVTPSMVMALPERPTPSRLFTRP